MSALDNVIGLVLAVLVTAYLVYALIFPRYFITEAGMGYRFEEG